MIVWKVLIYKLKYIIVDNNIVVFFKMIFYIKIKNISLLMIDIGKHDDNIGLLFLHREITKDRWYWNIVKELVIMYNDNQNMRMQPSN